MESRRNIASGVPTCHTPHPLTTVRCQRPLKTAGRCGPLRSNDLEDPDNALLNQGASMVKMDGPGARGQSLTDSKEPSPRTCRRCSLVADTVPRASSFVRVRPSRARPQSLGRGGSTGENSRLPWLLATRITGLRPPCDRRCGPSRLYREPLPSTSSSY